MLYCMGKNHPLGGKNMTKTKWVRLIYGIILSAALIVAGLCLMGACISIYQSGDRPFSREAVALQFSGIAVPVYAALALTAGSFILSFALPKEKAKKKAVKDYAAVLRRLWERRDISYCGPTLLQDIKRQQKNRKLHTYVSFALLLIGSITFIVYAVNPGNFPSSDITGSMARGSLIMLACLAVPFGYAVFTAYFTQASMKKEIELVRSIAPSREAVARTEVKESKNILRWVLLCVGIGIVVYGYFAGGTADVLTKAVNICTECVGLG